MRLINVHTFELCEFNGADIPHYAILSHRWEDEEVTFQDFLNGRGRDMKGWKKIEGCCRIASQDKLEWAWVDSCCIDKSSSAELSEAINSMFRWYRDSVVCYTYLSDVIWSQEGMLIGEHAWRLGSSKWFTRGWTLQELLAPDDIKFFNRDWQEIGTKESLGETISQVTGIHHLYNYQDASVAQKMSWASQRVTTRIEDQAYCLLGIFGINMPPLYGEGEGAFLQLQLEILKISNDESLFAWRNESMSQGGLLARSPRSFQYAGDIISVDFPRLERPPYMMTNKGIEIWVRLESTHTEDETEKHKMFFDGHYRSTALNCARARNTATPLSIVLRRDPSSAVYNRSIDIKFFGPSSWLDKGPFSKPFPSPSRVEVGNGQFEKIWIRHSPPLSSSVRTYTYFRIPTIGLPTPGWEVVGRVLLNPELGRWGVDTSDGVDLKLCGSSAGIVLQTTQAETRSTRIIVLKLGCGSNGGPVFGILFDARTFENESLDTAILDVLRSSPTAYDITTTTHELGGLAISLGSGKYLKASFQRTGGPGSREIITIRLEEVQELRSTHRIC